MYVKMDNAVQFPINVNDIHYRVIAMINLAYRL